MAMVREKGGIFDVISAYPATSIKKMSRYVAVAQCHNYDKAQWI
jgi:hypothetical protein